VTLTGENRDVVARLSALVAGSAVGEEGAAELTELLDGVEAAGIDMARLRVDVSIARGLDYYTGTVYETFLDDLRDIGSCCSGGRYDDLASLYTKQDLPGVGASLGVDRLLAAMEELGLVETRSATADVLVTLFDKSLTRGAIELAAQLRREGISVELYPDPRKLSAQLRYADRRGHRIALIAGPTEAEAGTVQVKDLLSGESEEVPGSEVAAACRRLLER
jgi:histidyl-tRNA synthetase